MAKAADSPKTTATGYCMKCKTTREITNAKIVIGLMKNEEWSASDRRDLPSMQHQDVQNRRQQVSLG